MSATALAAMVVIFQFFMIVTPLLRPPERPWEKRIAKQVIPSSCYFSERPSRAAVSSAAVRADDPPTAAI